MHKNWAENCSVINEQQPCHALTDETKELDIINDTNLACGISQHMHWPLLSRCFWEPEVALIQRVQVLISPLLSQNDQGQRFGILFLYILYMLVRLEFATLQTTEQLTC